MKFNKQAFKESLKFELENYPIDFVLAILGQIVFICFLVWLITKFVQF